jgi:protein-arginine kinase activator protein McsA
MKQQKCERCGTTKQTVEYTPIENEESRIIACKVCDKKLSKMLKGLHWKVIDVEKDRSNKDYEEKIKGIKAVWKEIPLSKKEKEEISALK